MREVSQRVKLLRGTATRSDRRDRDKHLAKPPIALPKCPPELSPEAKREFRRTGAKLVALGLVSEVDTAVLGGYSGAYALWLKATRELEADGRLLVPGPNGVHFKNPLIGIIESAATSMRRFATEMGLSARSRTTVPAVPVAVSSSSAAERRFFGEG